MLLCTFFCQKICKYRKIIVPLQPLSERKFAEGDMVVLAQLAEHRIVVPSVVGSSPTFHPKHCKRLIQNGLVVCVKMETYKKLANRAIIKFPDMKNEINALIMEAMKNHDSARTETLRGIKSAFLNWQTSKENAGKELTEADEIQIIKKMVKQRQESVEQYIAAGRKELADAEQAQIDILETFLPQAATEEDIVRAFNQAKEANGWEAEKKNMGLFVKAIKAALPNADGKMVAQVVQSQLA